PARRAWSARQGFSFDMVDHLFQPPVRLPTDKDRHEGGDRRSAVAGGDRRRDLAHLLERDAPTDIVPNLLDQTIVKLDETVAFSLSSCRARENRHVCSLTFTRMCLLPLAA